MEIKLIKNESFIYKVNENESLLDISNKFKISESKLMKENNLTDKNLEKGDLLFIENENNFLYTVLPLDNLNEIAKKFNVTVKHIIEKNKLNNEHIFIGQILII